MNAQDDYRNQLHQAEDGLVNVIEAKVKASTAVATVTTIIVAALGVYVFKGTVPDWVTVVIETAATGVLTFLAGYRAKHTSRTPAEAGPADPMDGGVNQRSL